MPILNSQINPHSPAFQENADALRGNKADLNPIRAARSLALAQAGALTGAALIGLYAGQALGMAPDWDLQASRRLLWGYAGGLLAALWLLVAGLLAQSWCRIPPRDRDGDSPTG